MTTCRYITKIALAVAVGSCVALCSAASVAGVYFTEDFNTYSGNQNNTQGDTGLPVAHSGNVSGWSTSGAGTMHAVKLAAAPDDWAIMLFQDNVITQTTGVAANASGASYEVTFDYGTGVYAGTHMYQKTEATDSLLVEVLRGDNTVLASGVYAPGAWSNPSNVNLSAGLQGSLLYTGDGSGNVRLRVGPTPPYNSGNFEGEIDNLAVSDAAVAPPTGVIFTEDFDGVIGGTFNGGQYQSGLDLAFGANVAGWAKAGAGAVHVVDHANVTGNIVNPRNFAPMLWGGSPNILTMESTIFGSNTLGELYEVEFLASPSVYQAASQASQATEGVLIEVLRGDNSVLASHTSLPGAWAGNMAFVTDGFQYTGDGTGDIRFRVSPSNPGVGRFGSAIDDLQLSVSVSVIPEPSSFILAALGLLGLIGCGRLRRRR